MLPSKLWVVRHYDTAMRAALAEALAISPVTASVLLGRGVTTATEANRWLSWEQAEVHDPFLLPDVERAVDRLSHAIAGGEKICFYGDYDVDGVSATSLYLSFFQSLGARAVAYIPHRLREGYGLNVEALRRLQREGVTLLVTSDCGTTAVQEVEAARQMGIDIIVTDHHQTDQALPSALAVINPHRADSSYPFKGLCSGGLAYKVAQAYTVKYGEGPLPLTMNQDLVALSTVADVVPLQDENRVYVREGLVQITRGARCGLRALKQVAGVTRDCVPDTVAFRLAPRLNAAGRLADAMLSVRLLTTESEREARELAEELERLNRERQQIEDTIMREALSAVDEHATKDGIVLGDRRWHLGVVGIVAGRLVERFQMPTVVIAIDEKGIGKGSVRTIPSVDVYQALCACRDLLEGFGGHPSAAGLTIRVSRIPEFRERFASAVRDIAGSPVSAATLHLDAEVQLPEVTLQLVRELSSLHPFGAGNPEPMLAVRGLSILNARVVGTKHLKLSVRQGRSLTFDSIGFGLGDLTGLGIDPRSPVDLAFVPELNHWNGYDRIQLRIRDLRMSARA
jgi:single-stranded-DNA-specific exonuclease